MKRGLELLGIGLIDVENHECMTLGAIQTPNAKTLEEMDYNLVDWYRELLISMKDRLQSISKLLVADAFFAKKTFIVPLLDQGFHVVSRLRNDAALWYPTQEKPIGKRGRPRLYDGKIDFANLDATRCVELHVDKGRLFGLKAYSKALKRTIKVAIWYPDADSMGKWQIYFSTDETMTTHDVINAYRTRFQLEFPVSRCQVLRWAQRLSGQRPSETGVPLQRFLRQYQPDQGRLQGPRSTVFYIFLQVDDP